MGDDGLPNLGTSLSNVYKELSIYIKNLAIIIKNLRRENEKLRSDLNRVTVELQAMKQLHGGIRDAKFTPTGFPDGIRPMGGEGTA